MTLRDELIDLGLAELGPVGGITGATMEEVADMIMAVIEAHSETVRVHGVNPTQMFVEIGDRNGAIRPSEPGWVDYVVGFQILRGSFERGLDGWEQPK